MTPSSFVRFDHVMIGGSGQFFKLFISCFYLHEVIGYVLTKKNLFSDWKYLERFPRYGPSKFLKTAQN